MAPAFHRPAFHGVLYIVRGGESSLSCIHVLSGGTGAQRVRVVLGVLKTRAALQIEHFIHSFWLAIRLTGHQHT